jgi:hypothetical protein
MPGAVRVTRVTVEYKIGNELVTVEFDPMKVQSIVFDQTFKERAVRAKAAGPGTKETGGFHAEGGIPRRVENEPTHVHTANGRSNMSSTAALWWVNDEGVWFHPEDQS